MEIKLKLSERSLQCEMLIWYTLIYFDKALAVSNPYLVYNIVH